MKQLAQAGIQNQMLSFSTVMKIFTDPSLSSIMRRIETDEQNMQQNKQAEAENQGKQMQAQLESNERVAQLQRDLENLKNMRDNETKVQVALIGKEGDYSDEDSSDLEKIRLQREKLDKDYQLKSRQLTEVERHNSATESIQRNKPKTIKK